MSHPEIYTKSYFQDILCDYFKSSSLKVTKLLVDLCNAQGGGFLSSLYRVTISYDFEGEEKKINLIAKSDSTDEFALDKIGPGGFDVQNKEIKFFSSVAPEMKKIFGQNVITKVVEVDAVNEILIFEDLCDQHFMMCNRTVGLDEQHMRLALSKLAKFHAASLKMLSCDEKVFDTFDVGMFNRKVNAFNGVCLMLFEAATEEVESWGEDFKIYAKKMRKLQSSFVESATKCFDVDERELNVLNHGDVWTTNLLFKYDEGVNVEDAVLIDFQFCHYGSAALDLNHFLFTSLNDDLYNQKDIERFVQFYYNELKAAVIAFECESQTFPSLHEFVVEFHRKLLFGFVYTSSILPVMTSNDPDNDFVTQQSTDEKGCSFRRRIMKGERSAKLLKRMLPYFDSLGILDEM